MTPRALLAMIVSSLAIAGPCVATAYAGEPPSAEGTLASCLRRSDRLLVVLEVDRSGSIAVTDPGGHRVDGLSAALMGLEQLADDDGRASTRPKHVDVLLASFAGTADPLGASAASQWRTLDAGSLNALLHSVEKDAHRDTGRDTDYVLALSAARAALQARVSSLRAARQRTPCELILFVTDGRYELTKRVHTSLPAAVPYAPGVRLDKQGGAARAEALGRRILCKPNGLMDQIANEGTVLFTVALSASSGLDPRDRAFLQALTTGAADDGQTCGADVTPASGEFVSVRDSGSLFLAFSGLLGRGGPIKVCGVRPCTHAFRLEPGLAGFVVDASGSSPDFGVTLTGPTGASMTVAPNAPEHTVVSGAGVLQHWVLSRSVEVQATLLPHDRSGDGAWRLAFFSRAQAGASPLSYRLRLRSSIHPRLVGRPSLARGKTSLVGIELADDTGTALREGLLARSAHVRAWVAGPDKRSRSVHVDRLSDGRFSASVLDEPTVSHVRLDVEVSFPGYGEQVEPVYESLQLPRPPPSNLVWLILGSLLVLLLVLMLLARAARRVAAARFPPLEYLRVLALDVRIVPNQSVVSDPPLDPVRFKDFTQLANEGSNRRSWSAQHDVFRLRARVHPRDGFSPLGEARADFAQTGPAQLLGGTLDGPLSSFDEHRACEVPLALSGTWLFAVQRFDDAGELQGRLLLISDEVQELDHGQKLFAAARAALFIQGWDEFERVQGGGEEPLLLRDHVHDGPLDWSEL